ncbi:Six-hairpin glycosidase [Thozetella sp. PMI_491]|nr:Six-hairpin glycosidase [Thozetella sp. PMI_491]
MDCSLNQGFPQAQVKSLKPDPSAVPQQPTFLHCKSFLRHAILIAIVSIISLYYILSGVLTHTPATATKFLDNNLIPTGDRTWRVDRLVQQATIELQFPLGLGFVLDPKNGQYVLPNNASLSPLEGFGVAWVLPNSSTSSSPAYMISVDGPVSIRFDKDAWICIVTVKSDSANITAHKARPHADIHGDEFLLDFPGGDTLADALAGFYWGTMLPSVIERTTAISYPLSTGFVISTLASMYVGTYPDVDHEFQIKGRIAMGGSIDLAIVRRMLELELKLIREDPTQQHRAPCALQPTGEREYHVRRNSEDDKTNANMFLVTGNIELLESVWLYIARTKDLDWLRANIEDVEGAAWLVEWHIDPLGRLWSDVYYEDQVMKDGRETMSAALASRGFGLLAQLEGLLKRNDTASRYRSLEKELATTLVKPLPLGYWDAKNGRFIDWVDQSGVAHDHIHLLANILPVMMGATDEAQTKSILSLIDSKLHYFQRFPTFLAVDIADYTEGEIGDGGPYDLCAAGRYWAWDAAFWQWRRNGNVLRSQLEAVAAEGRKDGYIMGERYDMDYIYYVDGVNWHGAAHYYEYPCVYAWVLIHEFLGVRPSLTADLEVAPRLVDRGSVTLNQGGYRLAYNYQREAFTLKNLANATRVFSIDLRALYPDASSFRVEGTGETLLEGNHIHLKAMEVVVIKPFQ